VADAPPPASDDEAPDPDADPEPQQGREPDPDPDPDPATGQDQEADPDPGIAPAQEPESVPDGEPEPVVVRRVERYRHAFVAPWSRRRARRVGLVAAVLVVLGPVLGTAVALLLIPSEPGDVLDVDQDRPAVLDVRGTIRSIDPVRGEMNLQLVVVRSERHDPDADTAAVVDETGLLTEDLTLVVNDADGRTARTLAEGGPPGTVTATLALTGSRANRYPVDRYKATLLVAARTEDGDAVPVRLSLRSSEPEFTIDVADATATDEAAVADLRVGRRGAVIGWAAFFVVVCWMLAIGAASIGWTTVVHGITSPAWGWGFLIGILFALPPLRSALPGSPPSGSLVDLAAFYWAVGIVALTVVAMIGSWNVRVRRAPGEPDSPAPRA